MPLLIKTLDAWQYATADDIQKAGINTQRILARYERTKDAAEIRSWLINGPGEAPGTQVNLILAQWALQHREEFTAIVEGLPARHRDEFIQFFVSSLGQAGMDEEFKQAFRDSESRAVKAMLRHFG